MFNPYYPCAVNMKVKGKPLTIVLKVVNLKISHVYEHILKYFHLWCYNYLYCSLDGNSHCSPSRPHTTFFVYEKLRKMKRVP